MQSIEMWARGLFVYSFVISCFSGLLFILLDMLVNGTRFERWLIPLSFLTTLAFLTLLVGGFVSVGMWIIRVADQAPWLWVILVASIAFYAYCFFPDSAFFVWCRRIPKLIVSTFTFKRASKVKPKGPLSKILPHVVPVNPAELIQTVGLTGEELRHAQWTNRCTDKLGERQWRRSEDED